MRGQRSQLLGSTARAALLATTVGVMAMVVAMALMTGYTGELRRKLIGLQAEIVAQPLAADAFSRQQQEIEQVAALPAVARVSRAAYGEGSVSAGGEDLAVTLKGIDPRVDRSFGDSAALLDSDSEESANAGDGLAKALIGAELAQRMGAEAGDPLRLVVLGMGGERVRFRYRTVRVVDTFNTGFAEFDNSWMVLDRKVLEQLRGDTGINVLEVKLVDAATTDATANDIERLLGADFVISNWQRLNRELFTALALQELALFLVLGLIVVVSTFNIASTLVILVRERMRDIGVLGALGLEGRKLWWIFVTYGVMLGTLGIGLGVVFGTAICWAVTYFEIISFPPEIAAIYFIDSVPFRVEAVDLVAIVGFALAVTFAASTLPALGAARVRPATALRYE